MIENRPTLPLQSTLFSTAPMVDRSDRYFRYLMSLLSNKVTLYTPMLSFPSLIYGRAEPLLASDFPVDCAGEKQALTVVQVGGSQRKQLAQIIPIIQEYGYQAIDFNVGCPSQKVKKADFGVYLYRQPELVQDMIRYALEYFGPQVSIKQRIGLDELDSYEYFEDFIGQMYHAGLRYITIHARKALSHLDPKKNRQIPPLKYDWVYQIKKQFPQMWVQINGGVSQVEQVKQHLQHVDSVMIARASYENPSIIAQIDQSLYQREPLPLGEVFQKYWHYVQQNKLKTHSLACLIKPIQELFKGQAGTKQYKRLLSQWVESHGQDQKIETQLLRFSQERSFSCQTTF